MKINVKVEVTDEEIKNLVTAKSIILDIASEIDDNYIECFGDHDRHDLLNIARDIEMIIEELKEKRTQHE